MRTRVSLLVPLAAVALAACGAEGPASREGLDEPVAQHGDAITVSQAVSSGCSTSAVAGLSAQIIKVANCLKPGILTKVPSKPNFKPGSNVVPYMEKAAVDQLVKALDANPKTSLLANSMLRTIASQYLLYSWYQQGKCGIKLAAKVGNSNHETGLAVDISNYSSWKSTLAAHEFKWFGSADTVHFDFTGGGTTSLKPTEVKAFQMLWNTNHPGDKIAEDGDYGPATEARLKQSPAGGFTQTPACNDTDDDDDGILDTKDNCPTTKNADQKDTDKDGKGDACDPDDDNDTIADTKDNCPLNANKDQKDTDGDKKGDVCDPDDDNDTIADTKDNCPLVKNKDQQDTDKDGEGDVCDDDDDGDGVPDTKDNCPLVKNKDQKDADKDGKGDACETDDDGDGIPDTKDNCPTVPNADQKDSDKDGKGDACDTDDDADGIDDKVDNCLGLKNTDQQDTDKDGEGDACDDDDDGDGVPDATDDCPLVIDPDQHDIDGDGQGDVCDDDRDGDDVPNATDNCPDDPNEDQADADHDGKGDACQDSSPGEGDPGGDGGSGGDAGAGGQGGAGGHGGTAGSAQGGARAGGASGQGGGHAGNASGAAGAAAGTPDGAEPQDQTSESGGCSQVSAHGQSGPRAALWGLLALAGLRRRRQGRAPGR
jgi:MYXO-CTERM domain-containing protein